jgi:ABC-type lipopolysaccharide export system ATPase subunit
MKRYAVAHNLVRNPRTPTAIAINLVSRLREKDLKLLTSDRNVTELVRVTARKQILARQQRQKVVSFRKGH